MNDPWMQHLAKYNLLELHQDAQQVNYRIRVANGYHFHLEYEGGLNKLYLPGFAIKQFLDTDQGRLSAKEFLASVKSTIDEEGKTS